MNRKLRWRSVALAVMLCFVVLFSACCVVMEANHDCLGERCLVCAVLSSCNQLLETLALGCLCLLLYAAVLFVRHRYQAKQFQVRSCATPVLLKVKLSD